MDKENENIVKTKIETDRKCPNCGGTLEFDPSSGKTKCPYCDSEFDIPKEEEIEIHSKELDFKDAELKANSDWGIKTKTVICSNCGADSVYDELVIASECPFCGSNQVMEASTEGVMAPGGVCTFKISKEKAEESFKKWIKRKWFCPKKAKNSADAKSFKGIFVPAWTFDTDTVTVYRGEYGEERTETDSKGNSRTVIDWYRTSGTYSCFINDHTELATDRYDSAMVKKLLPFDTENNLTYKPEYIEGFYSEKYSVGLGTAWERAKIALKPKIRQGVHRKIESDHFTNHSRITSMSTAYNDIKYKYLLLPVWISSYTFNGKIYRFMVNGESGRVSGKAPVSALRILIAVLVALGLIFLLYILFKS